MKHTNPGMFWGGAATNNKRVEVNWGQDSAACLVMVLHTHTDPDWAHPPTSLLSQRLGQQMSQLPGQQIWQLPGQQEPHHPCL